MPNKFVVAIYISVNTAKRSCHRNRESLFSFTPCLFFANVRDTQCRG